MLLHYSFLHLSLPHKLPGLHSSSALSGYSVLPSLMVCRRTCQGTKITFFYQLERLHYSPPPPSSSLLSTLWSQWVFSQTVFNYSLWTPRDVDVLKTWTPAAVSRAQPTCRRPVGVTLFYTFLTASSFSLFLTCLSCMQSTKRRRLCHIGTNCVTSFDGIPC